MTNRYNSATCFYRARTSRTSRRAIRCRGRGKSVGAAVIARRLSRYRRCAVLSAVLATGCAEAQSQHDPLPWTRPPAITSSIDTDPAADNAFFLGYIHEVVLGDSVGALRHYTEIMRSHAPSSARARAFVRAAPLAAARGDQALAREHVATASALADNDRELLERADRTASMLAGGDRQGPLRGPPLGTYPDNIDTPTAAAFEAADRALARYYRRAWVVRLEGLNETLREKRTALEDIVARYRGIAARGGSAAVAANLRIGVALHDSALAMLVVPPELEEAAASQLRQTLRRRARGYLERAQQAYIDTIQAASNSTNAASVGRGRWRRAAESGKLAVEGLLNR